MGDADDADDENDFVVQCVYAMCMSMLSMIHDRRFSKLCTEILTIVSLMLQRPCEKVRESKMERKKDETKSILNGIKTQRLENYRKKQHPNEREDQNPFISHIANLQWHILCAAHCLFH